ncbi:hypothetical protein CEP53_006074 [Fusarium sp. AF-6]|nr:hypothetical protein CEP53_006074 [Fusarium sp. AF-6]
MAALSENPLDDPNPSATIALRLVLGVWETLLSAAGPYFKWTPALKTRPALHPDFPGTTAQQERAAPPSLRKRQSNQAGSTHACPGKNQLPQPRTNQLAL